jgi:hypothetical protein
MTQKTTTDSVVDAVVDEMRRKRQAELHTPSEITRESLTAQHGRVWDTSDLSADFEVRGFMAPYVIVRRKSDGLMGSMEFTYMPRCYFNFVAS